MCFRVNEKANLCGLIQAEDAMQEALRMAYWATLLVLITLVCVRIPPEGATARGNIYLFFLSKQIRNWCGIYLCVEVEILS